MVHNNLTFIVINLAKFIPHSPRFAMLILSSSIFCPVDYKNLLSVALQT
jgi:hypothetical protein